MSKSEYQEIEFYFHVSVKVTPIWPVDFEG